MSKYKSSFSLRAPALLTGLNSFSASAMSVIRYLSIAPSYYRNAVLGVFVYDVSQPSTLEDLKKWAHDFQTYSMANSRMVVLGNKCDLEPERILVSPEAGEAFATGEWLVARLFLSFSCTLRPHHC